MKRFYFITGLILLANLAFSATISEQEIVDQFGWRASAVRRVAVLAKPITGYNNTATFTLPANGAAFQIRKASDNSTAYAGTVTLWNGGATNAQSGDQACWADFSAFNTPGTYYLFDPTNNLQSYNFDIRDDIYNNVMKTAGRFFFYQRCGGPIDAAHGGNWNHTACHEGANQDLAAHLWNGGADQGQPKDVHGGWHDAGDFNKYVPFVLDAMFALLMAYELNPGAFGDDWNIPETGNGVPDILDEIKWELDWMLRMQNADGSVCNRVGVLNYVNAYPQNDTQNRYYTQATSWATSTLCGLAAHAARLFASYTAQYPGYSTTLTTAAQNAWTYLTNNAAMTPASGADGGGTNGGGANFAAADGGSTAPDDARRRLFAAAELYKTTGLAAARTYFEANYNSAATADGGHQPITSGYFDPSASWQTESAMVVYASTTGYATTAAVVTAIKNSLKAGIENTVTANYTSNTDPYRSYMYDGHYCWGSNQIKAQWATLCLYGIYLNVNAANNALYKETAEEYLHYFHGRNPLSYVYLTNMGAKGANLTTGKSCMQVYHGWFSFNSALYYGAGSTYGQAPGLLAGGANQYYDQAAVIPPASQPPQKSFKDWGDPSQNSWEVTEPGIYYQAKYFTVLSYFCGSAGTPTFTPTNTPYAGTPTYTFTRTMTMTVTLTQTITATYTITPVLVATIIYDGDTAGATLADGTVTNGAPGSMTQVTGGNPGNMMKLIYTNVAGWWQVQQWTPGTPKNIGTNIYLTFNIRQDPASPNTITQFYITADTNWSINIDPSLYLVEGGAINTTWKTARIPLSALLDAGQTVLNFLAFDASISATGDYTVDIDNVRLEGYGSGTPTNTPVITSTATPTRTATPSGTYTGTRTNTVTYTRTATATGTQTFTLSMTPTRTGTPTYTVSATASFTPTRTATPTNTQANTFTFTPVNSATFTSTSSQTATSTRTNTQTNTPVNTATFTVTSSQTATPTRTNTQTNTPVNTATFTVTSSQTATSTRTNTQTNTPVNSSTLTGTPTLTTTPSRTNTQTNTPVNTSTFTTTQSRTSTATPSGTPTYTGSATLTRTGTATPTFTITITGTWTGSATATVTPTFTDTRTMTASATPTGTSTRTQTYTATATLTSTWTMTATCTFTISNTWTPGFGTLTDTPTVTQTSTATPTGSITQTYTRTATNTATGTSTYTASPSVTYTATRTNTASNTATPSYSQTCTGSPTFTGTPTPTRTPTFTITWTSTAGSSPTYTMTGTSTAVSSFTASPSATRTASFTPSMTGTNTATATFTASQSTTQTGTPSNTATGTCTRSATASVSPTNTYTRTQTATPTRTLTWTPTTSGTPTATYTDTPNYSPTETDTGTPPTSTDTPSITETGTFTNTGTGTPTDTNTPIDTDTATPTVTYSCTVPSSPTYTGSATASITLTLTLTSTLAVTPTDTPAGTPTNTAISTATRTPTLLPTETATPTPTSTRTITPSMTRTATPSPTPSISRTPLSTSTFTPTPTLTANPAGTPTSTAVPSDKLEIKDLVIVPNPYNPMYGDFGMQVNITMPVDKIAIRVYTVSLRRIIEETQQGTISGIRTLSLPARKFSRLASGLYYIVVLGEAADGKKAVSKPVVMVVLR